jgi:hypothetical protein
MNQELQAFEALPMPRKDIPQPATGRYRIYKDARQYITVDADSALEALQQSGVGNAVKIERESIDYIRVMHASEWSNMDMPQTMAPQAQPMPQVVPENMPAPQATAAEPQAIASDAPLSNDDVSKLLNS